MTRPDAPHEGQRAPNPELRDTRTHEALRAAFATDAQAAVAWRALARVAEIEGHPEAARVLREVAEVHETLAGGHLDFLMRAGEPIAGMPLGETPRNVLAALTAERVDGAAERARTARAEGFPDIASWFDTVGRTRAHHAARLEGALAATKGAP